MNGKPGNLARRHARAARGRDIELMLKRPCMVGTIALERLQMHSSVILVHVEVIDFYTVPFPIDVLSLTSVNCTWSNWNAWSDCSASCGAGTQLRYRIVEETAQNGGLSCEGAPAESKTCNLSLCPPGNVQEYQAQYLFWIAAAAFPS